MPHPADAATVPENMAAVLLTGHGGPEMLEYRTDVATPSAGPGEVLIKVRAAGVNNTDINTRIGWYSKTVSGSTDEAAAPLGDDVDSDEDGGWGGGGLDFPRVQGADCCGIIVATGDGVPTDRIGQRVIVRSMQPIDAPRTGSATASFACTVFGSEMDGGFAEYAVTRSSQAHAVDCDWTDVELASLPCAYSTAEGLLHRANVGAETVLITGASGGVGSAAVQLAKRRGATVIAVSGAGKAEAVAALGADRVIDRDADLVAELGASTVDVVVDLVAGASFGGMVGILKTGGRYAVAGAIAGPLVELDVRDLYLKDLTFFGCTFQEPIVFENLVRYVEAGEIRPTVAATYPLADIGAAQEKFLAKDFVGKLVLTIDGDEDG